MASVNQKKRRKLIQMAEGYLDLTIVFEDRWQLDKIQRIKMADRAIGCLEEIKKPAGHKPYILFLKGQAHRTAERYYQAINLFQQSAELDPENLHTCLALAWCYKRTDKLELAVDTLKLGLKIDPKSAITHYNLACYWALLEDIDLAILHLSMALDFDDKFREFIVGESDFDLIRDNPGFQAITSVSAGN